MSEQTTNHVEETEEVTTPIEGEGTNVEESTTETVVDETEEVSDEGTIEESSEEEGSEN
jgi:hypothetical protein